MFLENSTPPYYKSLDGNSSNIFFVNNVAKIKRVNHRFALIIDIDRDDNKAVSMIEENRLILLRFI
jgi:hypothetical protein